MFAIKPIKDYEGIYSVTSDGRIYSFKGKGRFLKQRFTGRYFKVNIDKKTFLVHRLVAIAFIPNPENLPVVDHIDGSTRNNKLSNLQWSTQSDNIKKARSKCSKCKHTYSPCY